MLNKSQNWGVIGSAKAVPALAEELEKTVGKTLLYEYGSQEVAASRLSATHRARRL